MLAESLTMERNIGTQLTSRPVRFTWLALLWALWIATSSGCASIQTLIIDIDVDVQVAGRDANGRAWQAMPSELIRQPRHPQAASPFGHVVYRGKVFEWRFDADVGGFGYSIQSMVSEPVCFRFDQARLTSNMHAQEIPLRVSWFTRPGLTPPRRKVDEKRIFDAAPPLCFSKGASGSGFGLLLDLTELFPSGNNFDIRWRDKDTNLLNRGIGNWIKIRVPYEYEGKREEIEVTLTAKDSKGRISYL